MTTSLPLPSTLTPTDPATPFQTRNLVFDHVPGLKELLPKHGGRPGFEYSQSCVVNLRRAQDEGWLEVENTMVYTIAGPRGEANMKLYCRGKLIPGQPTDSGARLCRCDIIVEELTGCWINPHKHDEPYFTGEEPEIIEPGDGGDTPKSGDGQPAGGSGEIFPNSSS
jgi:hypothetical protein